MSKEWKWETISSDNEYWNTPNFMMHYLEYRWKKLGFKNFLDLGCGLGRHSFFMAEQGYEVFAFDYSRFSINFIREKIIESNLNIKLNVGDMFFLPYSDESIDCMIAIGSLSNYNKKDVSLISKEIYRVLRNQGEVYISISSSDTNEYYDEELVNGNVFYSFDVESIKKVFKDFNIISIKHVEELANSKLRMPSYCILLKKNNIDNEIPKDKIKDNALLM